jgi:hypothetical protein
VNRRLLLTSMRIAWREPLLWACLVLMSLLVVADGLSRGDANAPLGIFGVMIRSSDANLTYGVGLALVAAAVCAVRVSRLDEMLHARGVALSDRFLLAGASGAFAAITVRLVAVLAGMVAGVIQAAWQAGRVVVVPAGSGSFSSILSGQARTIVLYLLAGLLGTLIAGAVRSLVAAALVSVALVVVYCPAAGAVAERAPKLIGALPWLPFGAIRALFSGNGAIFGFRSSDVRFVSTTTAGLVALGWAAALGVVYVWRAAGFGAFTDVRRGRALTTAGAVVASFGIGWGFPALVAGHVPWQWSAQWRSADSHGRSSVQIARRWPREVGDRSLYSDASAMADVDRAPLEQVPPFDVHVPSANELDGPLTVPVIVRYRDAIVTGNVAVTAAQYQLVFVVVDGHYRITRVEGPLVQAKVVS